MRLACKKWRPVTDDQSTSACRSAGAKPKFRGEDDAQMSLGCHGSRLIFMVYQARKTRLTADPDVTAMPMIPISWRPEPPRPSIRVLQHVVPQTVSRCRCRLMADLDMKTRHVSITEIQQQPPTQPSPAPSPVPKAAHTCLLEEAFQSTSLTPRQLFG